MSEYRLTGAGVTPAYGGLDGESYETYVFDFPPLLARAVRLSGVPAGTRRYISVGELAAFSPALEDVYVPSVARIVLAARAALGQEVPEGELSFAMTTR